MIQQKKGLWLVLALVMVSIMMSVPAVPLHAEDQAEGDQVIRITAKRFEYIPSEIRIQKGVPVVLEFTSLDRIHGFTIPDLGGIRTTIEPGKVSRVRIVVPTVGTYEFHCDLFCGDGHEGMTGKIIVED